MQTQVLFEHPLNEKMRTWLRIEFLIQQLTVNLPIADHAGALHFFRNVSELLDVFERGEVRTELLKELDRQQRKLQTWIGVPGVDQSRIEALIQQLKAAGSVLISAPRIGQFLREDRLIALVRQRLSIPGGCCSFDLPTLHIWLHLPQAQRDSQVETWIASLNPALNFVCIDVANGYSEHFVQFVAKAREAWPTKTICAGNVVTGEMCEELILSGADIVKVGIGPGSVCTTRVKTGVGYPQLSAVIECADAAHGLGGMIVSDGGCTTPGDVAKAFGGGADFVMLGGMLAGHEESGGRIVEENGEKFMLFYGMSSESAMKRHVGGVAEYRAAEGKTVKLPLRGPVENTARDILGGLRSACTYVGASRLKELTKRTTFIRVLEQENRIFNNL